MEVFRGPLRLSWKLFPLTMTGFFVFCQVVGVMCAIPDLAMARVDTILPEEGVVCPMDGTLMCPPSATSSPERQMKHSLTLDVDHNPVFLSSAASALITSSAPTIWSRSSVSSLAPASIGAWSVLRI